MSSATDILKEEPKFTRHSLGRAIIHIADEMGVIVGEDGEDVEFTSVDMEDLIDTILSEIRKYTEEMEREARFNSSSETIELEPNGVNLVVTHITSELAKIVGERLGETMALKCMEIKNNTVFLDNEHDSKVIVPSHYPAPKPPESGEVGKTFRKCTSTKLFNCRNVHITILHKITHLLIHSCHNVTVHLRRNIVAGMDIIDSSNITIVQDEKAHSMYDVAYSHNVKFYERHTYCPPYQLTPNGEPVDPSIKEQYAHINGPSHFIRVIYSVDVMCNGKELCSNMFNQCWYGFDDSQIYELDETCTRLIQ